MNSAGTRYSSPANLYVRGNVKYMLIVFMSVSVAFDTSVLISPSCFGHQLGGAACLSVSISLLLSLGLSAQQFICRWFYCRLFGCSNQSFGICLKLKNHFLDWEYATMLAFFSARSQCPCEQISEKYTFLLNKNFQPQPVEVCLNHLNRLQTSNWLMSRWWYVPLHIYGRLAWSVIPSMLLIINHSGSVPTLLPLLR